MDTYELLLILISFLLGLVCIHWMRLLDRYEREPLGKMVLAALVGGGCASAVAWGLYGIIESFGFYHYQSHLGALLVIGPVEELAKLIGLIAVYGMIRNDFNEPADGIVYIACVALGFSLIENFLYASYPSQAHLIFIRLLVGTPLHICFSALMGLSFYIWHKNRKAFHLIGIAYFLASVSHGLYDLMVFNHYSVILLGGVVVLIYGFTRNLFIYALAVSPHRISLSQTIDAHHASLATDGPACLYCTCEDPALKYTIAGSVLYHCKHCDHFTVTLKGLLRLFYHYAGIFKQTAKSNIRPKSGGGDLMTLYQGNSICPERNMAFFRLGELNDILEKLNYRVKNQMKSKWYLPNNLYRMDQPGAAIDFGKMVRDGKATLWYRLALPFGRMSMGAHRPTDVGRGWNWWAFFIPELWYAAHGLWGALMATAVVYALATYFAMTMGLSLVLILGIAATAIRLASGLWGRRICLSRFRK